HGRLGSAQEARESRSEGCYRHQQGDRQPRRHGGPRHHAQGPHRPGEEGERQGRARVGRQLHEQPEVRRGRRPASAVATTGHETREFPMSQVLSLSQIRIEGEATTKLEAMREAHQILVEAAAVTAAYLPAMLEREASVSTYMGNFLAIPHGTNESKEAILTSALPDRKSVVQGKRGVA